MAILPQRKESNGSSSSAPEEMVEAATSGEEPSSVSQIRDILFGREIAQYEQRFQQLEHLVLSSIAELRDEFSKSFASLEDYTKAELSSLAKRLTEGELERQNLKQLSSDQQSSLRDRILQQSKTLQSDVRDCEKRLVELIEQTRSGLENNKIDAARLAEMLNEVASRVTRSG